jgi:hypothetical protein
MGGGVSRIHSAGRPRLERLFDVGLHERRRGQREASGEISSGITDACSTPRRETWAPAARSPPRRATAHLAHDRRSHLPLAAALAFGAHNMRPRYPPPRSRSHHDDEQGGGELGEGEATEPRGDGVLEHLRGRALPGGGNHGT